MLFNSIGFVYFFAAVFILYYLIPHKLRWVILLGASYYFYATWKVEYLIYLILPTVVVYFLAIAMERCQTKILRRLIMLMAVTITLGLLFTFKYLNLFMGTIASIFRIDSFSALNLLLPIGISFYTFKMISYIVDVYNGRTTAENHLGYFALYVSFFPQLLAGPIDRAIHFLPELKKKVTFDWQPVTEGLKLIILGVFKKIVIADRMALYVNQVFSNPGQYQGIDLLLGIYFYSIQIYCDFSGYSDIAIGCAKMLGFTSMDNFNYPYFSKNLTQFWNRWHISLSTWLRDYLFLPISYTILRSTRKNRWLHLKVEQWAYAGGMGITMFLGGLWHGASWTFVIWGSLHGFYLIFSNLTKKTRKRWSRKTGLKKHPRLHGFVNRFVTFHLVSFAWIFFRSPTFDHALQYIKNIHFGLSGTGLVHGLFTLTFALIFVFLELGIKNREKLAFIFKAPLVIRLGAYVLFVCLIIVFSVDSSNEFIYFQF